MFGTLEMKNLTRESGKLSKFDIEKRWSKDLVKDGWMPVSNYFLENYHKLKPYDITHSEAMFIIHVMQFKWDENAPHPGYKTIAKRMGISDKSARRYAQSLEQKGYLNRKKRVGQTNRFDFEPLIKALIDLKKESNHSGSRTQVGQDALIPKTERVSTHSSLGWICNVPQEMPCSNWPRIILKQLSS